MDRHIITLDLSSDDIDDTLAALRRAIVSQFTTVFDAVRLTELAHQIEAARTSADEPVEVEFTPRSDRGEA